MTYQRKMHVIVKKNLIFMFFYELNWVFARIFREFSAFYNDYFVICLVGYNFIITFVINMVMSVKLFMKGVSHCQILAMILLYDE